MQIIDGRKIQKEILAEVRREVSKLSFQPVFTDVLVGDDPASAQYVRMKGKMAESVGIRFHNANFPNSIQTDKLITELKKLNKVKNMCGIIIQLPLPAQIDRQAALDAIDSRLDVDCLGDVASGEFYAGLPERLKIGYPTALACMKLLDSIPNIDFKNPHRLGEASKKIVVLGQGMLVGKPVATLLKFRGLNPEIVTSKTPDKKAIIKNADVVISGMGRGKYITGEMIKAGAVIIDAGTSEDSKYEPGASANIIGDVDTESVQDVASYVSPVPGGVGPVTVAQLLKNVLTVAKSKIR